MRSRFYRLQFFADGAPAGGEGGAEGGAEATGVEASGTPGRTLEELGVPKEKAERFRRAQNRRARAAVQEAAEMQPAAEPQPDAQQAAEPTEATEQKEPWEAFMERPENKERMQRTVQERLSRQEKNHRAEMAEATKFDPALPVLGDFYGIRPDENGRYDREAVATAVMKDKRFFEKKAQEMGVSTEIAQHMDQLEREKAAREEERKREEAAREQEERDQQLRTYFYGVAQQARELREIYPDLDINQEMQNAKFRSLVDPDNPARLSVKEALWAVHGEEIAVKQAEAIARKSKELAAKARQAGQSRPRENGSSGTGASAAADPREMLRQMTPRQRKEWAIANYPPPAK